MADDGRGAGYAKGRRTRAEIVSAAFLAFSESGFRGATMSDIAARCGVTRAGLSHHFDSKEALLAAALEERDRVVGELIYAGADPAGDGEDYLRRIVRSVEHNVATPHIVALFATLSAEAVDAAHPAHAYFAARYRTLREDLRDALQELAGRGAVREGVDLAGLDVELVALIDGLQLQWLLEPDRIDMAGGLRRRLREVLTIRL